MMCCRKAPPRSPEDRGVGRSEGECRRSGGPYLAVQTKGERPSRRSTINERAERKSCGGKWTPGRRGSGRQSAEPDPTELIGLVCAKDAHLGLSTPHPPPSASTIRCHPFYAHHLHQLHTTHSVPRIEWSLVSRSVLPSKRPLPSFPSIPSSARIAPIL